MLGPLQVRGPDHYLDPTDRPTQEKIGSDHHVIHDDGLDSIRLQAVTNQGRLRHGRDGGQLFQVVGHGWFHPGSLSFTASISSCNSLSVSAILCCPKASNFSPSTTFKFPLPSPMQG